VQKRKGIVEDLAKMGKPAIGPLIRALGDENRQVRSEAAWALGKIKDRRAVEPLICALADESNIVRTESAFPLGEIGDKKAIKPLETILLMSSDVAPGTIEEARKALYKIRVR
jgi:bilin biosynthesis protein